MAVNIPDETRQPDKVNENEPPPQHYQQRLSNPSYIYNDMNIMTFAVNNTQSFHQQLFLTIVNNQNFPHRKEPIQL